MFLPTLPTLASLSSWPVHPPTHGDIFLFFVSFVAWVGLYFVASRHLLPPAPTPHAATKARAWVITLASSTLVGSLGLYYTPLLLHGALLPAAAGAAHSALGAVAGSPATPPALATLAGRVYNSARPPPVTFDLLGWAASETPFSRAITIVFIASLLADLLVGVVEYPGFIAWTSGWGHHLAYVAVFTGFLGTRSTHLFTAFGPAEWPTMMLAVGSILPSARCDAAFGAMFFLTRLVWFAWVMLPVWGVDGVGSVRGVMGVVAMCMHVVWFRGWVRSYCGGRRKTVKQE